VSLCDHDDSDIVHYDGYLVIRATVANDEQKQLIEDLYVDVWSHESNVIVGVENDMAVSEEQLDALVDAGLEYEVLIQDLEANLSDERKFLENTTANADEWYTAYHRYEDIIVHINEIAKSARVTLTPSIGKTVQGRDIPGLVISEGDPTGKKKIFFNGGQHAREWVSPTTVLYITEQLATSDDADVKKILEGAVFVIVPIINPDGYSYTWTSNRLWRKNRRQNAGGSFGVDLNRNWNDHWGGEGSSSNPNSDIYHGTAPFSEPETLSVSNFVTKNGPFIGAIDFHSYSQLILRPYGWSRQLPPNDAQAKLVGDTIRATILAVHNQAYTSQPSWALYPTTGSAQDWYYGGAKIPLSYTIELRDTGRYGFQLPANQIIPTAEENWAAVKYFATYIISST